MEAVAETGSAPVTRKKKILADRNCKRCRASFTLQRSWQEYCSDRCRKDDWDEQNPRIAPKSEDYVDMVLKDVEESDIQSRLFQGVRAIVYRKVQKKKRKS